MPNDQPTHTARTPEEYRILLLERQLDHVIQFMGATTGRDVDLHDLRAAYQEQRREFPLASERTLDEPDVDDVLREAELALEQAGRAINPYTITDRVPVIQAVIANAQSNVRKLLASREGSE